MVHLSFGILRMGFAGGPVFDFLYTSLQATSGSFEGKMAKGKALTEAQGLLIPGWSRNVYKAGESALNGEYYKAFLQLNGAGLDQDFFDN